MSDRTLRGHCLCEAIQYTVDGAPAWCAHCHCADCRRHTGSAVATFVGVERHQLTLTAGEFRKIESSPGNYRSFCANCGTPMAYETDKIPGEIHLYLGTLANPEQMRPTLEVFCRERLPWLSLTVAGPSFEGLPDQDEC